jgi:hypothetical protein
VIYVWCEQDPVVSIKPFHVGRSAPRLDVARRKMLWSFHFGDATTFFDQLDSGLKESLSDSRLGKLQFFGCPDIGSIL